MKLEDIAGTVNVKGRGGTVLQPGIDLLDNSEDFPKEAPLLIITDGFYDKVILYGREHAFLVPYSAKLPFIPKGKVFSPLIREMIWVNRSIFEPVMTRAV